VRKIFIVLIFVAIFTVGFAGSYFLGKFSKIFVKNKNVNSAPSPTPIESPLPIPESSFGVLLLGHGGAGHQGGTLMDSIILVYVSPEEKKALLISIPRDLYLGIPTDYNNVTNHKINEAFSIGADNIRYPNKRPEFKGESGGWELMKYSAELVTGLTVKHFIAIDFSNYIKAIDTLGGVSVDVPKTYDDYFYPVKGKENETCGFSPALIAEFHQKYSGFELEKQFTCRYEHIHFDPGIKTMNGETALKYTRSRHGDGDFGRSQRQFAVLKGLKDKMISAQIIPKGGALFDKVVAMVKTDIGGAEIKALLALFANPSEYQIKEIHLTEENYLVSGKGPSGQFILTPKEGINRWEAIKRAISVEVAGN
jgi:anionic cell wall polymer biosynthesis LytR-Cps2A-Psr (LCP) family protein